ncbi:hypothetical protein [Oligoflexus tunisiensis]|uniref:hypothetical protein n=1 Tax=Oligoflexus tunisiensis TaxID=708132 RepID=UPI000B1B95F9|nr:hypothetical protein [Oligoflexus tunisiensis]
MTGFWRFLISVTLASGAQAGPAVEPYVKNLALIGVIHVQGAKSKSQSVAVVRDKSSGRTRMLHKGDRLVQAELEVRELGPQHITLVRGTQTFVLRVESYTDTSTTLSNHVETTEVELTPEKTVEPLVENESKPEEADEPQAATPEPDCEAEACASAIE